MSNQVAAMRERMASGATRAPIGELVGIRFDAVDEGRAVFSLAAGPQHANPMGTLHGGIVCTLADFAMGMAFASTLEDGETFTTLELKVNFLRPVWSGTLTATGTVSSAGKQVGLVVCDVVDGQGRAVAYATSTCMKLRGDRAEGRAVGDGLRPA
jgi:uncharacterized protein (TIGR00369 family)